MTIFSVQRFLEDYFERRGLADVDQYAVRAANAFERLGSSASEDALASALGRVRTAFFRRNHDLNRRQFERQLSAMLQRRFKKKAMTLCSPPLSAPSLLFANDFARSGGQLKICSANSN
jgi:hypothetical protein